MKEKSKAYMAGLMDADGTYTITSCIHKTLGHRLYDPTVACVSTFKPTLKWVASTFGGTVYPHKVKGKSTYLPRFDWVTQTYVHSMNFILTIYPYILQKCVQADILLDFYSLYRQQCPDKRQKLYKQITHQNSLIPVTTNTQDISWKPNLINAYFAGFFDGESTVGYSNYGATGRISLGNTNKTLLDYMVQLYGGNVYPMQGESRPKHRKPMWNWQLDKKKDIENFLLKVIPYLITKREKSIKLLNFVRT